MTDRDLLRRGGRILPGLTFGSWTVIRFVGLNSRHQRLWLCRCGCGKQVNRTAGYIASGRSRSCGCVGNAAGAAKRTTHGLTKSGTYNSWRCMKKRCTDPTCSEFQYYGGRGITVCARWLQSFENFLADVGERPSRRHSLDRINNNGNYEPGNVRWATPAQQNRNHRGNVMIEWNGRRQCLSDWASQLGIYSTTLAKRLKHLPLSVALTAPAARTGQQQAARRATRKHSSPYRGVTVRRGRYIAQIKVGPASRQIGTFANEEDAARAYDSAARLAFGVYATTNFPVEGGQ